MSDKQSLPEPNDFHVTGHTTQTKLSRLGTAGMTLEVLAIALWLGGLVAIGAIVAPVTFHIVRSNPALLVNIDAQNSLAGGIVGGSLRIFNWVCAISAVILTIGMASRDPRLRKFAVYRIASVILAVLVITLIILIGFVFPQMDIAQAHGDMRTFDHLHNFYEQLSKFELGLLLIFTGCYSALKCFRILDD